MGQGQPRKKPVEALPKDLHCMIVGRVDDVFCPTKMREVCRYWEQPCWTQLLALAFFTLEILPGEHVWLKLRSLTSMAPLRTLRLPAALPENPKLALVWSHACLIP